MPYRNKGRNLYNQKACDSGLTVSWYDPQFGLGAGRVTEDHGEVQGAQEGDLHPQRAGGVGGEAGEDVFSRLRAHYKE